MLINTVTPKDLGREPGTNTIAYYKFENNLNDSSGNNRNLSGGTFTYGTIGSKHYINVPQNQWTNYVSVPVNTAHFTMSMWIYFPQYSKSRGIIIDCWLNSTHTVRVSTNGGLGGTGMTQAYTQYNKWTNLIISADAGVYTAYINGEYYSHDSGNGQWSGNARLKINNAGDTSSSTYSGQGYLSELILEDKTRSQSESGIYFRSTKSNYIQ